MPAAEARFWRNVDRESPPPDYAPHLGPCWLWTAALATNGYGKFSWNRQHGGAHRFSYELIVGPIPEGLHLDHLCRVRHCVNPAHLEPVTCKENLRRGQGFVAVNAAKTHCPQKHEYTPENTITDGRGRRYCRQCGRLKREARKQDRAA